MKTIDREHSGKKTGNVSELDSVQKTFDYSQLTGSKNFLVHLPEDRLLSGHEIPPLERFYETDHPTRNGLEKRWIGQAREKSSGASDFELL